MRNAGSGNFSKIQKFIDLKENNLLYSPEESAERLTRIINNPEKFDEVIMDVRNLSSQNFVGRGGRIPAPVRSLTN